MGLKAISLIIAIVLVAAVGATLAVVLTASPAISALDLVPQDADFVANIEISKILTDEDVVGAYDEAEKPSEWPETFDDALDWVEDEIGIDLTDFTSALIFGDIESRDFGAIVKGTFDPEALIESIEDAIGEEMATSTYKGYEIHSLAVEDEAAAICFLSDDIAVVGLRDVVKDVIDVREGAPHLSGLVYDTYNSLGDVWIKGALEVPEEAVGGISEWDAPISLEAFEDLEAGGFGFNKAGEDLSLQIKLYFSDVESAADAEDAIGLMVSFIMLVIPDMPDEVVALLDGLSISQSDSWLTITLETTVTEVRELMEELQP